MNNSHGHTPTFPVGEREGESHYEYQRLAEVSRESANKLSLECFPASGTEFRNDRIIMHPRCCAMVMYHKQVSAFPLLPSGISLCNVRFRIGAEDMVVPAAISAILSFIPVVLAGQAFHVATLTPRSCACTTRSHLCLTASTTSY